MTNDIASIVKADIDARVAAGAKVYGNVIMLPHDGRDTLWHAYEEALDLTLYLRKLINERTK